MLNLSLAFLSVLATSQSALAEETPATTADSAPTVVARGRLSLAADAQAIGRDTGFGLALYKPVNDSGQALVSVGYQSMQLAGIPKGQTDEIRGSYSQLQVGYSRGYQVSSVVRVFGKAQLSVIPAASALGTQYTMSLDGRLGAEVFAGADSTWSGAAEFGVSQPWGSMGRATKFEGSPLIARGAVVQISLRNYLNWPKLGGE